MIDLSALNVDQRAAVERTNGPLLVLAGAGSGKTRTLTYRIANILESGLASPHSILAITFTRKAAWEMRRRLADLVGSAADDVAVSTFHAFGFKLLSAEGAALGFNPAKLKVMDASEARRLLLRALKDAKFDPARWSLDDLVRTIERAKDNLRAPADLVRVKGDFFEESLAQAYARYQQLLMERNAVDYGDLIRLAMDALRRNADALAFYQSLFRYISVDEFQDTSFAQYQLVSALAAQHKNLCCVGSPLQTIYSWRGADINNILSRFRADFPDAPVVGLHDNYRSTGIILEAAQAVVQTLPYRDEDLRAASGERGRPIQIATLSNDWNEANYIAAEIRSLADERQVRYDDIAILYRTRPQGRMLEQMLIKRAIPYTLIGDRKFFESREIRDVVAYLRVCYDITDAPALQRIVNVPPRGLGQSALEKLQGEDDEFSFAALSGLEGRDDLSPKLRESAQQFADLLFDDLESASRQMGLPQFFEYLLERTGYRAWVEQGSDAKPRAANLAILRTIVERYDAPQYKDNALAAFLADIAVMDDEDLPRESAERGVTLATVHAVKGLEFPIVFIAGLEEENFPHVKALQVKAALEEEQRLVYVAMTRAERALYLTWARARADANGELRDHAPSRFLGSIPRALMERRPLSSGAPPPAQTPGSAGARGLRERRAVYEVEITNDQSSARKRRRTRRSRKRACAQPD